MSMSSCIHHDSWGNVSRFVVANRSWCRVFMRRTVCTWGWHPGLFLCILRQDTSLCIFWVGKVNRLAMRRVQEHVRITRLVLIRRNFWAVELLDVRDEVFLWSFVWAEHIEGNFILACPCRTNFLFIQRGYDVCQSNSIDTCLQVLTFRYLERSAGCIIVRS